LSKEDYGQSEASLMRYETYQAGMRRALQLALAGMIVGGIGMGLGVWGVTRKPEDKYFATQRDGQILPLVALGDPYLSESQVLNFAVNCVTKSLTITFDGWKENLSAAQECFTEPGWEGLTKALTDSSTLDFIRTRRLNATATATGASVVERGRSDGRYVWRVKLPIHLTFASSSETTNQEIEALVEIVRTPTYENTHGVAINRFIAQPK
jgi:intracellular multiplication protein IcmL